MSPDGEEEHGAEEDAVDERGKGGLGARRVKSRGMGRRSGVESNESLRQFFQQRSVELSRVS